MPIYLDLVILLNFLVDLLLLLGTNRLCGYPASAGRAALAAGLGGLYGGACLLPGFGFLGNFLWRLVSLAALASIAFGISKSALRRGVVFVFLCTALGGAAAGMGTGGFLGLVLAAAVICLMCVVGFRGKVGERSFVKVELTYQGNQVSLTALQDTGNTLRDPVSGKPVLVVGAETAQKLTGLTMQQLRSPLESVGALPGLRLIPYRAVGKEGGLLLAMKLQNVKIGSWKGSSVVAFAPEGLGGENEYQALTGGAA